MFGVLLVYVGFRTLLYVTVLLPNYEKLSIIDVFQQPILNERTFIEQNRALQNADTIIH